MCRKWDKIDLDKIGKLENSTINLKIIDKLKKEGKSIKEIAKLMNMKYHTIYMSLYRLNKNEN